MSVTVDSSTIISNVNNRDGKIKLIFNHHISDGRIIGPFVEHRLEEEDSQEFLQSNRILLEQSLNQPPPDEEEQLLEMMMGFGDEIIKSALQIDETKLDSVKDSYETIKNPDTKGDAIDIPVNEEVQ